MKTDRYETKPKYSVRMRLRDGSGHVYLQANGRHAWSKRVAAKHMKDICNLPQWLKHYDEFAVVLED